METTAAISAVICRHLPSSTCSSCCLSFCSCHHCNHYRIPLLCQLQLIVVPNRQGWIQWHQLWHSCCPSTSKFLLPAALSLWPATNVSACRPLHLQKRLLCSIVVAVIVDIALITVATAVSPPSPIIYLIVVCCSVVMSSPLPHLVVAIPPTTSSAVIVLVTATTADTILVVLIVVATAIPPPWSLFDCRVSCCCCCDAAANTVTNALLPTPLLMRCHRHCRTTVLPPPQPPPSKQSLAGVAESPAETQSAAAAAVLPPTPPPIRCHHCRGVLVGPCTEATAPPLLFASCSQAGCHVTSGCAAVASCPLDAPPAFQKPPPLVCLRLSSHLPLICWLVVALTPPLVLITNPDMECIKLYC